MSSSTLGQLIFIAMCFGGAYVFWMTYQNPRRNGLTRFVNSYMESMHPPAGARPYILLNVVIILAIALAALGFFLAESFGPLQNLLP
jgi:hypothetical protein